MYTIDPRLAPSQTRATVHWRLPHRVEYGSGHFVGRFVIEVTLGEWQPYEAAAEDLFLGRYRATPPVRRLSGSYSYLPRGGQLVALRWDHDPGEERARYEQALRSQFARQHAAVAGL